jgi:hypothetical protein
MNNKWFTSMSDAFNYVKQTLIPQDHIYIIEIHSPAGAPEPEVYFQVVSSDYPYEDCKCDLTVYLAFDLDFGQKERHRRFLQLPERRLFTEVFWQDIPCYAALPNNDVEALVRLCHKILIGVYVNADAAMCEIEVSDEGKVWGVPRQPPVRPEPKVQSSGGDT